MSEGLLRGLGDLCGGIEMTWAFVGICLFVGGTVSSLLVLLYQCAKWLQFGHWPSLPFGGVIAPRIEDTALATWLIEPHSWYGLHSVVVGALRLPLSVWLFILGLTLGHFFFKVDEGVRIAGKARQRNATVLPNASLRSAPKTPRPE